MQCQDAEDFPSLTYSLLDMSRQSRWYHMLQSSQHIAPPLLSWDESQTHLMSHNPQGNIPAPRAGPGWGCMSQLIISAIRKYLLSAMCVIHLCFSSPLSVKKVKAAPARGRTADGSGGGNKGSGPLKSLISVVKFESLTARNTTIKKKFMTAGGILNLDRKTCQNPPQLTSWAIMRADRLVKT